MGELRAALEDSLAGKGRLVMLAGEPGIGKTRIAQELATLAEQRGARVLWGRCYEGEGAPPYWPWAQLLANYFQRKDPNQIIAELGPLATNVAEIVPEVRDKLPGLELPPPLEPEQARFRLFQSFASFLKNISQNKPLVLIVDDLHWADTTSLLFLEYLATELEQSHIMALGSYRDVDVSRRHPLSQTLGHLIREQLFKRVQLRGMSSEEVEQFIEIASETSVSSEVVDAVHSRTEGNPLFVTEVVRLLEQEGFVEGQSINSRIPEGIRDAIGRRLSGLSEDCNHALTTASVIGREFSLEQLEHLVETRSEDDLLQVLEEASDGYVIEEAQGSIGSYRFTHALIQQTLASELSTIRKVRIHARIAEVLEEIYGDSCEAHAEELAHHYGEAAVMIGPEKMAYYSLLAGQRALAAYAWEDAQVHFERGLGGEEGLDMNAQTAAMSSGLGYALAARGQHERAAINLKKAFTYYSESGDVTQAVATVSFHHDMVLNSLMEDSLSQALELVPADSLESARLLCSYGLSIGTRGNGHAQGQESLKDSLAIAQQIGDIALERRIMAASAQVDGSHMKWDRSLEKSLRALELSVQVDDDPIDKLRAHMWANNSWYAMGYPESALAHNPDMSEIAESMHDVYWLELAISRRRILAYLSGDWKAVHGFDDDETNVESDSVLAMASFQTGDFDRGKTYMDALKNDGTNDLEKSRWSLVAACFCNISGESDLLADLEVAAKNALVPELPPIRALEFQVALAQVAILRREPSNCAELYAALTPYTKSVTQTGAICTDRLLGLLARTMGNLDESQTHFEDAITFCRKAGYRPELCWSLFDYAEMVTERNKPGDVMKARELLDESDQIASGLGMKPLSGKVAIVKTQLEARPASQLANPGGLTEREVEVLRLVAAGRSNREIGEDLFISVNTVARHVAHIFSKTDSANRAEAATYANQQGLL
jgi:DNA-binding CsgD family transcriptional regulator/tetratricopeptide (TPR) repeat protein